MYANTYDINRSISIVCITKRIFFIESDFDCAASREICKCAKFRYPVIIIENVQSNSSFKKKK